MTPQASRLTETFAEYFAHAGKGTLLFLSAGLLGSVISGVLSGLVLPIPAIWFLALAMAVASRGAFVFFSLLGLQKRRGQKSNTNRPIWDEMACPKRENTTAGQFQKPDNKVRL